MFFDHSFEKKLFAATIGSAALVVAKKSEETGNNPSKTNPFLPKSLYQNYNVNGLDSITRDDVELSLRLDKLNLAEGSPVLLKNAKEAYDVGNDNRFKNPNQASSSSPHSDMGILRDQDSPQASRIRRRLNPKSTKAPKDTPAPIDPTPSPTKKPKSCKGSCAPSEMPSDVPSSSVVPSSLPSVSAVPSVSAAPSEFRLPAGADMVSLVKCAILQNYSEGMPPCEDPLPYGPMEDWIVSDVTDFTYAFGEIGYLSGYRYANKSKIHWESVNPIIEQWDTSSATSFNLLFSECKFYGNSPDLSGWNVEKVKNMERSFARSDFDHEGIADWKPRQVTSMEGMFRWTGENFNQNLNSWGEFLGQDTNGQVVNIQSMFASARNFNHCLDSWAPLTAPNADPSTGTFSSTACPNDDPTFFCCESLPT